MNWTQTTAFFNSSEKSDCSTSVTLPLDKKKEFCTRFAGVIELFNQNVVEREYTFVHPYQIKTDTLRLNHPYYIERNKLQLSKFDVSTLQKLKNDALVGHKQGFDLMMKYEASIELYSYELTDIVKNQYKPIERLVKLIGEYAVDMSCDSVIGAVDWAQIVAVSFK